MVLGPGEGGRGESQLRPSHVYSGRAPSELNRPIHWEPHKPFGAPLGSGHLDARPGCRPQTCWGPQAAGEAGTRWEPQFPDLCFGITAPACAPWGSAGKNPESTGSDRMAFKASPRPVDPRPGLGAHDGHPGKVGVGSHPPGRSPLSSPRLTSSSVTRVSNRSGGTGIGWCPGVCSPPRSSHCLQPSDWWGNVLPCGPPKWKGGSSSTGWKGPRLGLRGTFFTLGLSPGGRWQVSVDVLGSRLSPGSRAGQLSGDPGGGEGDVGARPPAPGPLSAAPHMPPTTWPTTSGPGCLDGGGEGLSFSRRLPGGV